MNGLIKIKRNKQLTKHTEFKINQSAKTAIKQIKDKKYAAKYADDKRPIYLLGINFDTEKKWIDDYLIMNYEL